MDTRLTREQVEQIIISADEKGERPELSGANLIKVDLKREKLEAQINEFLQLK